MAIFIFILLFIDDKSILSPVFLKTLLRRIIDYFDDFDDLWIVYLFIYCYFIVTFILHFSMQYGFRRADKPGLWLAIILVINAYACSIDFSFSSQAVIFLFCVILSQCMAFLVDFNRSLEPAQYIYILLLFLFIFFILLTFALLWCESFNPSVFTYNSQIRWTGPWDNPNVFGVFMGAGMFLAIGLLVKKIMVDAHIFKHKFKNYALVVLFIIALGLMCRGLFHSYSRGAWTATIIGLVYLICRSIKSFRHASYVSRFTKLWLLNLVIVGSSFMLFFWHFMQSDWLPARRAFSAVNPVDLSWRNRVGSWEGALQIVAEHPWFGTGWNRPAFLYDNYFLPAKITEGGAIEMNDYFMLAATLGAPALFCFGMYVWGTMNKGEGRGARGVRWNAGNAEGRMKNEETGRQGTEVRRQEAEWAEIDWLQTTCHAGAIVLLAGFWFDGGLFKLPTAATFWILLELGAVGQSEKRESEKAETGDV